MSVIELHDPKGTQRGYALLAELSAQGWSAVVTPDGDGGIEVVIGRIGSRTLRESGQSVAEVAPRLYERASCLA